MLAYIIHEEPIWLQRQGLDIQTMSSVLEYQQANAVVILGQEICSIHRTAVQHLINTYQSSTATTTTIVGDGVAVLDGECSTHKNSIAECQEAGQQMGDMKSGGVNFAWPDLATEFSIPSWIIRIWQEVLSEPDVRALAAVSNMPGEHVVGVPKNILVMS